MEDPVTPPRSCDSIMQGVYWWATLVVAVLAVPAFGLIVSAASGTKGFFAVGIFISACWVCTFLGMRLMQNPAMARKVDLTRKNEPN